MICIVAVLVLVILIIVIIIAVSGKKTVIIEQGSPAGATQKHDRYCPNCGRAIPFDANVCPYCGKQF